MVVLSLPQLLSNVPPDRHQRGLMARHPLAHPLYQPLLRPQLAERPDQLRGPLLPPPILAPF